MKHKILAVTCLLFFITCQPASASNQKVPIIYLEFVEQPDQHIQSILDEHDVPYTVYMSTNNVQSVQHNENVSVGLHVTGPITSHPFLMQQHNNQINVLSHKLKYYSPQCFIVNNGTLTNSTIIHEIVESKGYQQFNHSQRKLWKSSSSSTESFIQWFHSTKNDVIFGDNSSC